MEILKYDEADWFIKEWDRRREKEKTLNDMRLSNLIFMSILGTKNEQGRRAYQRWYRELKLSLSFKEEESKSPFERFRQGGIKTVFERLKEIKNGF